MQPERDADFFQIGNAVVTKFLIDFAFKFADLLGGIFQFLHTNQRVFGVGGKTVVKIALLGFQIVVQGLQGGVAVVKLIRHKLGFIRKINKLPIAQHARSQHLLQQRIALGLQPAPFGKRGFHRFQAAYRPATFL